MQANIFGVSIKGFLTKFVTDPQLLENLGNTQEYKDFDPYWYKDIGYQICLNLIILSLVPHIFMPIVSYVREKIGLKMAQRQKLQKNVKKWIEPE